MGLADLTDRNAVLRAIAEFDQLGREAFLAKYGIAGARGWLVVDERGREYDAKAIAGAAHGFQFPGDPLPAADFQGGEATARVLRRLSFTVRRFNPIWTRDELILALELYLRRRPTILDKRHPDVIELSKLLGKLAALEGRGVSGELFRNANGVGMKLSNLARLDPEHTTTGRRGLAHGGRGEEEVWRDFAGDEGRLQATAAAIRAAVAAGAIPGADEYDESSGIVEAPEGRVLTALHRRRERNRALVEACKAAAIKRHGRLVCEGCDLDPAAIYGDIHGRSAIECHHTRPVHTLAPDGRTRLEELALLCANCHRAVHAGRSWLTVAELRELLAVARRGRRSSFAPKARV